MPYCMTWTVEMILSRTLRFINVRACGDYNENCRFWHEYGGRAYYDPGSWEHFSGSSLTTAMLWEN